MNTERDMQEMNAIVTDLWKHKGLEGRNDWGKAWGGRTLVLERMVRYS